MIDIAHAQTDKAIDELEKKVREEYKRATEEAKRKTEKYFKRFERLDRQKKTLLKKGLITQEEYNRWRYNKMCVGKRFSEMRRTLATDYANAGRIAKNMIYDTEKEVYALNHNFATYMVERESMMDTSYTLYSHETVEYLIKEDPKLLPNPSKASLRRIAEAKEKAWTYDVIDREITQGILQGESIPQISKRLEKVGGMETAVAVRNARTMVTSAENKGRDDAIQRVRSYGIDVRKRWIATLDNRTRHSHRLMNGKYADEEGYYENGLRYPGDPNGEPSEVYNCRCCEVGEVLGHSLDLAKYSDRMGASSYEEWLKGGSRSGKTRNTDS